MHIQVLSTTDQDFRDKFAGRTVEINLLDGLQPIEIRSPNRQDGDVYRFEPISVIREDGQPFNPATLAVGDILIFSSAVFIVRTKVVLV